MQKRCCQKVKNVLNEHTNFLVTIIKLLLFLNRFRNNNTKFEIYRTILTCLNQQKELTVTDGRTDRHLLHKSITFKNLVYCFLSQGPAYVCIYTTF